MAQTIGSGSRLKNQIRQPGERVSPLGRVLGVGQAALGIIGTVPTAGASLAAVPGGLKAAAGQRQSEAESTLGTIGAAVGMGKDLSSKLDSPQGVGQAQGGPQADMVKPDFDPKTLDSIKVLEGRQNPQKDFQTLQLFANAEKEMNELRSSNPQLEAQLRPAFFESMQELGRRFRTGEPISFGGNDGPNFNA